MATADIYRFAGRTYTPATRMLTPENGKPIELREQVALLLAYCLANPDRVLTRDELKDAIWKPDKRGKVVSQDLNRVISDLRSLFGPAGHELLLSHPEGYRALFGRELPRPRESTRDPAARITAEGRVTVERLQSPGILNRHSLIIVYAISPIFLTIPEQMRQNMTDGVRYVCFFHTTQVHLAAILLAALIEERNENTAPVLADEAAAHLDLIRKRLTIIITDVAPPPTDILILNAHARETALVYVVVDDVEYPIHRVDRLRAGKFIDTLERGIPVERPFCVLSTEVAEALRAAVRDHIQHTVVAKALCSALVARKLPSSAIPLKPRRAKPKGE